VTNEVVIVGALSDPAKFDEALDHAQDERRFEGHHARWRGLPAGVLPDEAPFWLYVPNELDLPKGLGGLYDTQAGGVKLVDWINDLLTHKQAAHVGP
jgi:hypothetical protein